MNVRSMNLAPTVPFDAKMLDGLLADTDAVTDGGGQGFGDGDRGWNVTEI